MGVVEFIFIILGLGSLWLGVAIVHALKNGGMPSGSGGTRRCPKCGKYANIKNGWWGSFSTCPYCGDKQNIYRSSQMQHKLDTGYYKKK